MIRFEDFSFFPDLRGILSSIDVPCLLVQILDISPWKRTTEDGKVILDHFSSRSSKLGPNLQFFFSSSFFFQFIYNFKIPLHTITLHTTILEKKQT